MSKKWQKIKEDNQYGHISYFADNKVINKNIKTVDIRWADGTIEKHKKVIGIVISEMVSEQGSLPYQVISTRLYVRGHYHGHKVTIPLVEVEIDVDSIKWLKEHY
jgi:hypothetical protein